MATYNWKKIPQQNDLINQSQIEEILNAITEINNLTCSSQFGSVNSTYIGCNCQSNKDKYYGSIYGGGRGTTSYGC